MCFGVTIGLGRSKNRHGIFLSLEVVLEVADRSRKPKSVELVKWLAKQGVQKIHQVPCNRR